MAVFNEIDRKNIMEYIEAFTEKNEHIISLIAVGSGSYGFNDELSDLDFVIAIDNDQSMESVMDYVSAQLNKCLKITYFKQVPQRRLQVYLSDSFLEIDIGYGPYTAAAAFQKNWRVIFDKSGTVDEAMKNSWAAYENAPKTERYLKKLDECSDAVWHYLMHAASAIKRKNYWRAVAELELTRNLLIGLLGSRYSLDVDRNKDADKLPEAELAVLQKTLVTVLSPDSLWSSLTALTDAVYTELERFGEQVSLKMTRSQINEYIVFCRNI